MYSEKPAGSSDAGHKLVESVAHLPLHRARVGKQLLNVHGSMLGQGRVTTRLGTNGQSEAVGRPRQHHQKDQTGIRVAVRHPWWNATAESFAIMSESQAGTSTIPRVAITLSGMRRENAGGSRCPSSRICCRPLAQNPYNYTLLRRTS